MRRLLSFRTAEVRAVPPAEPRSGWAALLPPPPAPVRRLEESGPADAVVVGAGFTGLAAARRLAELRPDWRVVVLEAHRAGGGASGRSSGFLVDVAYFTTVMAPEAAERHVRLSRAGISELRSRVAESGIDCAWDDTGWLHVAAGEDGLRDLGELRSWLDARRETYDWLDAAALERTLGTPFYRAGLRLPGRPLVQPAALVAGLLTGLPPSVELFEESPVHSLHGPAVARGAAPWRIAAGGGEVTAPRVLLATNGCTPSLGFLGDRLFPLTTYGSLTRTLSAEERATLGTAPEWGVLAQDPLGSSLRLTRDGRLLVRNGVGFSRSLRSGRGDLERAREAHRGALARRFPALAQVDLELTWDGIMGATPSRRHFFGHLDDGLWATAGFTGAGIAQGTIAGRLLADLVCGDDSELLRDMLALPLPGRLPPRPFQDLGIRWRVARMSAAAGDRV